MIPAKAPPDKDGPGNAEVGSEGLGGLLRYPAYHTGMTGKLALALNAIPLAGTWMSQVFC